MERPLYRGNFSSTANLNRLHSPNLWYDCPMGGIINKSVDGLHFFDDFLTFNLPATQTTAVTQGDYTAYCATAGQWIQDAMPHSSTAGVANGWISGLCDTDGDSMAIGTNSAPILLTTTQTGKFWFEARIATTSILTNMGQIFLGLCESPALAAYSSTVPLGNADTANATNAMIGWRRAEDGLTVLDTVYADHSTTYGVVQASANSLTLAANTAIKLGIKVDMGDATNCVQFYVNGIRTSTSMTKAALLALTYLDVAQLGPVLAFYADSAGTADYLYMDWWGYASTLG